MHLPEEGRPWQRSACNYLYWCRSVDRQRRSAFSDTRLPMRCFRRCLFLRRRPQQPVAIEESAIAKSGIDIPAVDSLTNVRDQFVHFSVPRLHAEEQCSLVLCRKILEVEGLACPNTNARKLRSNLRLLGSWRRELE